MPAMFALLNSTWVWANLELTCNVLGGGALKVEATDLRRLPLPHLDELVLEELARLGKLLGATTDVDVLADIDYLVAQTLNPSDPDAVTRSLVDAAREGLSNRSRS